MTTHTSINYAARKCVPCEGGVKPMSDAEIAEKLEDFAGWRYINGAIEKEFTFKDYYQTIAFVNAVAWFTHIENHHPELVAGYKTCTVRYSTHAIKGVSDNDFICAAKVNALVRAL
ncbi:MAG: 4a-hydroxytetrahydrobiopterin dehydratase [Candidatus Auribacter fodinae]|jgi:4a-hydroxytetrahydrobiopterin dehydratase|uniref:Putative pterin-4-alpha-carbinolamine dehydratase n=1 Tax=Candidatus Auribacter fodinae TaxID=2093366 RepID=A0A3A4QTD9_9BACT|nr:MAG: 4a-hydroxytetrahydrobiopterin dehydratase [Candidatus Auribacter fodinae]